MQQSADSHEVVVLKQFFKSRARHNDNLSQRYKEFLEILDTEDNGLVPAGLMRPEEDLRAYENLKDELYQKTLGSTQCRSDVACLRLPTELYETYMNLIDPES